MNKRNYFEDDNFITKSYDNNFIKKFSIENLITETLEKMENQVINVDLKDLDRSDIKYYLYDNIRRYYDKYIIPNVYFILIVILISIENGDFIKFNNISYDNINYLDIFIKNKLEEIETKNLFYKQIKYIMDLKINNDIFLKNINNFISCSKNETFGEKYYIIFLQIFKKDSNDFPEDLEISFYENLKEENKFKENNLSIINGFVNYLIDDEESKKGFLALLRQSYLLGKLRYIIVSILMLLFLFLQENEFIIGVFGKKKSGKYTFINKIFKECDINPSYFTSTIGLNLYTIKDIENFAIIKFPGDNEIGRDVEFLISKVLVYSKLLIYIIDEGISIDPDRLRHNIILNKLVNLRKKNKISLIILLTHFDNYCNEIKLFENENNWKLICKENIIKNKINILKYINEIENNIKSDIKIKEKDIMHVVLIEREKISNEEIIKKFPKKVKEMYDKADEEKKLMILETFREGLNDGDEIVDFLNEEMNVLDPNKLKLIIKENLPFKYHRVLK